MDKLEEDRASMPGEIDALYQDEAIETPSLSPGDQQFMYDWDWSRNDDW